jgi:myo-inositol-1(or 4)-monophosphatase
MGAVDGFYESGLKEWDWAAGGLIAVEAGAKFTQHGPAPFQLSILAGESLHAELTAILGLD